MNRLLPLALLPFLAACAEGPAAYLPPFLGGEEPEEVVPPELVPVPPEVVAHLPAGVPGTLVHQDANGCYVFSVEVTDPPTGYPVRDSSGNQICPTPAPAG